MSENVSLPNGMTLPLACLLSRGIVPQGGACAIARHDLARLKAYGFEAQTKADAAAIDEMRRLANG
jgi:hypothetical protein